MEGPCSRYEPCDEGHGTQKGGKLSEISRRLDPCQGDLRGGDHSCGTLLVGTGGLAFLAQHRGYSFERVGHSL